MLPPADEQDLGYAGLLQQRLFEQRTVVLSGPIDDDSAARAVAELMTLDASGDDHVELLLNSAEGSIANALMIMDTIDLLGVPVHATCMGRAEGPAVGVLAVAARRRAVPHARLRFVAPADNFQGRSSDVQRWAAARQHELRSFTERIADAMRRPVDEIEQALLDGQYLDAHEAMRQGLIDEIAEPQTATIRRIDRRPPGFRPAHRDIPSSK